MALHRQLMGIYILIIIFGGAYSTFSGQDIQAIYQLYQAGKINNLSSFTAGVVTAQGTTYLIKIADPQAFLSFGQTNFADSTSFRDFELFYNNWFNTYTDIMQKEEIEARELALLKTIENSGLKLFKGATNFNDWNVIKNENNLIVNTNCN